MHFVREMGIRFVEQLKLEVAEVRVGKHRKNTDAVHVTLTECSARALSKFTENNVMNIVVMRVDGVEIYKARFLGEAKYGKFVMATGSLEEAIALSEKINAGKGSIVIEWALFKP